MAGSFVSPTVNDESITDQRFDCRSAILDSCPIHGPVRRGALVPLGKALTVRVPGLLLIMLAWWFIGGSHKVVSLALNSVTGIALRLTVTSANGDKNMAVPTDLTNKQWPWIRCSRRDLETVCRIRLACGRLLRATHLGESSEDVAIHRDGR